MRYIALSSFVLGLALAATFPARAGFGDPDPSHPVVTPPGSFCGGVFSLMGDGSAILSVRDVSDGRYTERLVRILPEGRVDFSWGFGGFATLQDSETMPMRPRSILRTPQGGFIVAGDVAVRLHGDGTLDTAYGSGGVSERLTEMHSVALLDDGSLVVLLAPSGAFGFYRFVRLDADGRLDPAFGTNGALHTQAAAEFPYAWSIAADGTVRLATYAMRLESNFLGGPVLSMKRYPGGEDEPGVLPGAGAGQWLSTEARVDARGRLVLATTCGGSCGVVVTRWLPDGGRDPTFERTIIPMAGSLSLGALWLDRDGAVTVIASFEGGDGFFPPFQFTRARAYRLTGRGGFDRGFPDRVVLGDAPLQIAQLDDGRFLGLGRCKVRRFLGDRPKADARIVEYEHRGRYFVTAEGPESAILDADRAPERLRRTGRAFGGWLSQAGLEGSLPLCRFHGDAAAGPRGHFYSLEGAECDLVRADDARLPQGTRAWRFEGLAFSEAPAPAGACPATLQPVHRLFNDGQRRGLEPNHRHVIDPAVVADMQARGWILEGVAFCAPPN